MTEEDAEELPRSAVSLVRELVEELLDTLDRKTWMLEETMAEYRRRFAAIEDNLYSGPNSGY